MKILSAEFVTSAAGPKQFPIDRKPQVAFAGRSNVGKSSVINALLNRKNLVKTSSTPGKTQLINFFLINERFYCVDLPGYGFARAPKDTVDSWAPLIEGYFRDALQLKLVVVLIDIRRGTDARDRRLLAWLHHYGVPALVVMTKADKVKRQEAAAAQRAIVADLELERPPLLTSCLSGAGIAELRGAISQVLMAEQAAGSRQQDG